MGVGQRREDLTDHVERDVDADAWDLLGPGLLDQDPEVDPIDPLHDQAWRALHDRRVDDLDDATVVELGRDPGFAIEALAVLVGHGQGRPQHLDGAGHLHPAVAMLERGPDLAHPAAPERFGDGVFRFGVLHRPRPSTQNLIRLTVLGRWRSRGHWSARASNSDRGRHALENVVGPVDVIVIVGADLSISSFEMRTRLRSSTCDFWTVVALMVDCVFTERDRGRALHDVDRVVGRDWAIDLSTRSDNSGSSSGMPTSRRCS